MDGVGSGMCAIHSYMRIHIAPIHMVCTTTAFWLWWWIISFQGGEEEQMNGLICKDCVAGVITQNTIAMARKSRRGRGVKMFLRGLPNRPGNRPRASAKFSRGG